MGVLSDIADRLRAWRCRNTCHADMEVIHYAHAGCLSFRPDLPLPIRAHAIGWLGRRVRSNGRMDRQSMEALRQAHAKQRTDMGQLGYHIWRIYRRYQERGAFMVQANLR